MLYYTVCTQIELRYESVISLEIFFAFLKDRQHPLYFILFVVFCFEIHDVIDFKLALWGLLIMDFIPNDLYPLILDSVFKSL